MTRLKFAFSPTLDPARVPPPARPIRQAQGTLLADACPVFIIRLLSRGFACRSNEPTSKKRDVGHLHTPTIPRLAITSRLQDLGWDAGWQRRSLQGDEALGFTGGSAEPGQVGAHLRGVIAGVQGGVENGAGGAVCWAQDAVMHPLAFSTCVHQPGTPHVCKVA